jgi:hypothetical protein
MAGAWRTTNDDLTERVHSHANVRETPGELSSKRPFEKPF